MSHPEKFYEPRPIHKSVHFKNNAKLKLSDRLANYLTIKVGSMAMLFICALTVLTWIILNQVILKKHAFDPYPFAFLLTFINFIQLLLMPLIMIGQNIQGRAAEMRAQETYKNSVASYHDLEAILKRLSNQDAELLHQTRLLQALHEKNGIKGADV